MKGRKKPQGEIYRISKFVIESLLSISSAMPESANLGTIDHFDPPRQSPATPTRDPPRGDPAPSRPSSLPPPGAALLLTDPIFDDDALVRIRYF
jgi:hypothetical protein